MYEIYQFYSIAKALSPSNYRIGNMVQYKPRQSKNCCHLLLKLAAKESYASVCNAGMKLYLTFKCLRYFLSFLHNKKSMPIECSACTSTSIQKNDGKQNHQCLLCSRQSVLQPEKKVILEKSFSRGNLQNF